MNWLDKAQAPWWIAGGWAIALLCDGDGHGRTHSDMDIGCFRDDAQTLLASFAGWQFFEAMGGTLRALPLDQAINPNANSIWCRPNRESHWTVEVLLDDRKDDHWLYRRNHRITRRVCDLTWQTRLGPKVLRPEVQLLYKATAMRQKDIQDFKRALPCLNEQARAWLRQALKQTYPGHPWIHEISVQ